MGMAKSVLCTVLAVLTLAVPARGQAPPSDAPPPVDTIEIIAHLPGPALWRVSTAQSQLWILGLAGPIPKRASWDTRRVQAALDGARELVIPPGAAINLIDIAGLLFDPAHRYHMPGGKTLRASLPEPLRASFDEAARGLGQNPAHYDHWRPMVAALALFADAQKYDQLSPEGVQKAVAELAKAQKVPVRRLANYRIGELLRMVNNASPEAPNLCLSLAVDLVPHLPTYAQNIAEAWARGDVDGVKAAQAQMATETCLEATPGVAQLQDKVAQDWAKDLAASVRKPGKTVVAVDMESLTRKGGLLDQMRAQGLDVIGPAY
jgi:uncharacterized protein YbaP (TraB family)